MLLPWGNTTVLGHAIRQWQELGAKQIAVVWDPKHREIAEELERIGQVSRSPNDDPSRGMVSSVLCAARWENWIATFTHLAIALGDQPHLRHETLKRLIGFASETDHILQPSFNGRARHPIILPRKFFYQLRDTKAETLKDFLNTNREFLHLVDIADPGLNMDLDFPDDYERARKLHPPEQQ